MEEDSPHPYHRVFEDADEQAVHEEHISEGGQEKQVVVA